MPSLAYAIDANLNTQCLQELVEFLASKQPRAIIAALPISPEKALKWRTCSDKVDMLFCNRREAAALTDKQTSAPIGELGSALTEMGFANIVLTDASNSIQVIQHKQLTNVAVPSVDITGNVNGAGDALAGATLAHFIKTGDLTRSVTVAGISAAHRVLTGALIT